MYDVYKNIFLVFIDSWTMRKPFTGVRHDKLFEILMNLQINPAVIRIKQTLYRQQKAHVVMDRQITPEMDIQRGVRQSCVLSPLLFNLYAEEIFRRATEESECGTVPNGVRIPTIRYADDTVLMAESESQCQEFLHTVSRISA